MDARTPTEGRTNFRTGFICRDMERDSLVDAAKNYIIYTLYCIQFTKF